MTITDARDEIFRLLLDEWNQFASGVFTPAAAIIWQGQETSTPRPADLAYARATVMHTDGGQATLVDSVGAIRWRRRGFCIVQCFGPQSTGKGLTIAEGLATIAKNAFEGRSSPGGIWFRNCRINEVGISGAWFQVNAIAEFTYEEVK